MSAIEISFQTDKTINETMHDGYRQRFQNVARLYGSSNTDSLIHFQKTHVCVIGLGGVGSWVVESLARSGIGHFTLIDVDDICESNINRQIIALSSTVGKFKAEVLKERILDINPFAEVNVVLDFVRPSNAMNVINSLEMVDGSEKWISRFDFVVDAADGVSDKVAIIDSCIRSSTPIICSGGVGGLTDPSLITISDLTEVEGDNLLMRVRKKLRQDYGYPKDLQGSKNNQKKKKMKRWNIFAVHTLNIGRKRDEFTRQSTLSTCEVSNEKSVSSFRKCDSSLGTASFSCGIVGFLISSIIVNNIAIKINPTLKLSSVKPSMKPGRLGNYFNPQLDDGVDKSKSNESKTQSIKHQDIVSPNNSSLVKVKEYSEGERNKTEFSSSPCCVDDKDFVRNQEEIASDSCRTDYFTVINTPEDQSIKPSSVLFDAHCHAQLDPLFSVWGSILKEKILKVGINFLAVCGTCPGFDWEKVKALHGNHRNLIIPSYGLHPWWIETYRQDNPSKDWMIEYFDQLNQELTANPLSHVGECGLDTHFIRDGNKIQLDPTVQEDLLDGHLTLAIQHHRTITIYCVAKCWDRFIQMLRLKLRSQSSALPLNIILHSCNSLSIQHFKALLHLPANIYFSISGRHFMGKRIDELIHSIPKDRLLIETDSPDQLPKNLQRDLKFNDPSVLYYHAHFVAKLLDLTFEEICSLTNRNGQRAFQLNL